MLVTMNTDYTLSCLPQLRVFSHDSFCPVDALVRSGTCWSHLQKTELKGQKSIDWVKPTLKSPKHVNIGKGPLIV